MNEGRTCDGCIYWMKYENGRRMCVHTALWGKSNNKRCDEYQLESCYKEPVKKIKEERPKTLTLELCIGGRRRILTMPDDSSMLTIRSVTAEFLNGVLSEEETCRRIGLGIKMKEAAKKDGQN